MVQEYHIASTKFFRGNPEPAIEFFSHERDVSLANPFGGIAHDHRGGVAKKVRLAVAN